MNDFEHRESSLVIQAILSGLVTLAAVAFLDPSIRIGV